MAKNRKPFAVVTDYQTLINAFRRRKDDLSINHLTLDRITGLPSGYSGKLFGRANVRALGPISFGLILNALGLRMILVWMSGPVLSMLIKLQNQRLG